MGVFAMTKKLAVLVLVVFFEGVLSVSAQVSTSSITGVVTDASGAVVANARVEAKNENTGGVFNQSTTSSGNYSFASLTPGSYSITATLPGFQTFTSVHNILTVGAPLVVNVSLKLSAIGQTVEVVESNYQRLETSNATVSDIMDTKQVQDLPLNGRNPLSLLTLEPGVVQRSTEAAGSGTHVFGSRDRAHNVTIDGIDANESTVPNPQSNIQRLNPDNVQEFRTVTLDPTAEYGRNSGANVMVATRSGTNDFHGTAFYFNRNTVYNANEWFNNATGQPRPNLKLNQYGFDIGGPIFKNKTFFFGDFQYNNIPQTSPITISLGIPAVYTATARGGNFRYVVGTVNGFTSNSRNLVDANGNFAPGVQVCSASVTTNCIASYNVFANDPAGIGGDPAVTALINSTPLPNTFSSVGDGLNTAGFTWNPPTKFSGPNYMARVDHNFGPSDGMFVRWLQNNYDTKEGDFLNARPQVFPGFPPLGEVLRIGKNLAVSYRHVFSPNLVNEFATGFNRFAFTFTFGESNPNFGNPSKLPPWSDECVFGSFLNISSPYCVSPHTARAVTAPQFVDNLSWIHGAHTIRTGFNFRFYYHNDSRGFFGSGILAPVVYFNQSLRPGGFQPSNISSADNATLQQTIVEMLGIPAGIQQGFQANFSANTYNASRYATVYTRARQYDAYVQDEWHITRKIVLNGGLRWEINPPPFDSKQTLVPNLPIDGSQGPVTFAQSDRWYKSSNLSAIGPRVGVAWSPDPKTAVRVGYGWLFDTISTFQITSIAGKIPGFIQSCNNSLDASGAPTPTVGCVAPSGTQNRISQGFPVSVPAPIGTPSAALSPPPQPFNLAPSVGAFDPNLKNPSVHEWDLTIQHELPKHFVAEIGYIGKRGTHLYRAYDLNQINTNQPGFLASFNIARANVLNGCPADGSASTACPNGGQVPALLLQLVSSSFLKSATSTNNFKFANIGNFSQRVDSLAGANAITAKGFPANYFRPNPQFTQIFYFDSGGDSYYHGAFLVVRRRFEQGLDFGLTYTFSKSIDDMSVDPVGASTGGGLSTSNSRTPTDVHNFALDRSRSDFDNRHVLLTSLLYDFPIGRGKKFASGAAKWVNHIIGGWSISGIFIYQSGEPYTLNSGELTVNNTHQSSALVEGPLDQGHLQTLPGVEGPVMYNIGPLITNPADPHFNCRNVTGTQTFFCVPAPGQNGSGRNLAQGPNFWNLDSGFAKTFKMTERFNMQFRAEFFNVLNHPNFENPRNATVGSPAIVSSNRSNDNFGLTCCSTSALPSSATVSALGEPNRVIQLGLKLSF